MDGIGRTKATLRIFGDDLNPEEVTALLGAEPTSSREKGPPRGRRGSWHLRAEPCSPGDLNSQVKTLLSGLTDDLSVWRDLGARFRCDLFCGLFMEVGNEGEEFTPDVLAMIGARGLSLGLDIYGPDEE